MFSKETKNILNIYYKLDVLICVYFLLKTKWSILNSRKSINYIKNIFQLNLGRKVHILSTDINTKLQNILYLYYKYIKQTVY